MAPQGARRMAHRWTVISSFTNAIKPFGQLKTPPSLSVSLSLSLTHTRRHARTRARTGTQYESPSLILPKGVV